MKRHGPRNPRMITAYGETLTIQEWAERLGCKVQTIYMRVYRGRSDEEAITEVIKSGSNFRTHGKSKMSEYSVYRSMIARCASGSENYGGRGIRVCSRWASSFEAFLEDMGERPTADHSIDRINVNGDYACGKCPWCFVNEVRKCNCRWATRTEQQRNRRDTRFLTYGDKSLPLLEWAEITGIPPETIQRRLDRGWTVERSLTSPVTTKHRRKS